MNGQQPRRYLLSCRYHLVSVMNSPEAAKYRKKLYKNILRKQNACRCFACNTLKWRRDSTSTSENKKAEKMIELQHC
jgi:hypothetical protein